MKPVEKKVENIFIFPNKEPRYDENGLNSPHKRGRKVRLQVHTGFNTRSRTGVSNNYDTVT